MRRPVKSQALLKQVSRSFYLTLRILPPSIRRPISIAYMLARAADTITDTQLIETSRRHEALLELRASIQDACEVRTGHLPDFGDLARAQEMIAGEGTAGERTLLERIEELLGLLRSLEFDDRQRVGRLLDTITRGQESDLLLFGANTDGIVALKTDEELDRYTYQVAGCVGEFWTDMCRAHLFPRAELDGSQMRANGVRFGKGLQLVNILRDLPKDLQRGRCYIPEEQLARRGLAAAHLADPNAMKNFRPLYSVYLERAESYLSAGWKYTISVPFRCMRVRLACAWPLLIGIRTLERLRTADILAHHSRIKISRADIRRLLLATLVLYPFPKSWNKLFTKQMNAPG
jgi:farnesyl-diphosphate farnesyltransferase